VPTYRRPQSLTRCLDALSRQVLPPDEIIVVVRREDDASRDTLRECELGVVEVVTIDVPVGRPGLIAALNAGVDACHGDIVCLTDDDAEPRPDWTARIVASFAEDIQIGAVGGRDWISDNNEPPDQHQRHVGTMTWWGRLVGGHHLGVGPARDVAVLKGVNLSVRGSLIRAVRFDTRLRGIVTEHHWEVGLCLAIGRLGYRIVYDPAIAVDHFPQPRPEGTRKFGPQQIANATYNETLALLDHLSPAGKLFHLLAVTMVGSRVEPGVLRAALGVLLKREASLERLIANLAGRAQATTTHLLTKIRGATEHAR
jgi:hypothetical protein